MIEIVKLPELKATLDKVFGNYLITLMYLVLADRIYLMIAH